MTHRLSRDKVLILSDLIHIIYSDISSPGVWNEIFRLIQQVMPLDGATFRRFDPETHEVREFISVNTESAGVQAYVDYYHRIDPVTPKALAQGLRVFRDIDVIPKAVLVSSEYYIDYVLRYNRLPQVLVTAMGIGSEYRAQLILGRDESRSCFTDEDLKNMKLLEPHLSSALYEAGRQKELEKVKNALCMGIDNLPSAVFIFDKSCKLVHANHQAKSICDSPSLYPAGLYHMVCSAAVDLMMHPDVCKTTANSNSIEISVENREYRLERFLSDTSEYCCINLYDPQEDVHASVRKLCRQRGLSAREEDICRLLVKGSCNRDIAEALGISVYTVKDHVKSILSKMNVSNKNEILQLAINI